MTVKTRLTYKNRNYTLMEKKKKKVGVTMSEQIKKSDTQEQEEAMLVERIGYKVKMVEGSYNNIKITTQEDLGLGSQILKVQE